MKAHDRAYFDAMITLTAYPEWKILLEELKKEIYHSQANCLENASTWDAVCVEKGWVKGLAYVINLRDNTKTAMETHDADL